MAHKFIIGGLMALYLIAGCAGQTSPEDVQTFVNDINNKVNNVEAVTTVPATVITTLAQILLSINNIADTWWNIDWSQNQQAQWDSLVLLANSVELEIQQILPSIPESSGQTWGSIYPRDDLVGVAADICDEISTLKSYAEEQYGVLLTITAMTACPESEAVGASPTISPAPAPARRLLAA